MSDGAQPRGDDMIRGTGATGPPGTVARDAGAEGGHPDPRSRAVALRAAATSEIALLMLYAALGLVVTAAAWASPTTRWAGGCCDPEQTMWFLGWVPHALAHGLDPLFTTMLNAPDGVNLMWNASTPLLSVLAAPFLLVGGPIFAYNALLLAAFTLNGWLANLALRRYASGRAGPILGGIVYALSPYAVSHASLHLNLAVAWAPPLFLIVLDELLIRRRHRPWRLGVALGLIAAAQLLVSEEVLATSVIAAGVLVVVLAAWRPAGIRDGLRRLVPALVTATMTFLVVAAWPLATQFLGPQRIHGAVQDADTFATDLANLVLPTRFQLIAPDWAQQVSSRFSGLYHEATGYLGLPLLVILGVVAARRWHDPRIRVAFTAGAATLVLSLGPHLHVGGSTTGWAMPWLPLASLPILENVLPARLTLYAWLAIAGIVAMVAADWAALPRRSATPRLAALVAALVVIAPAPLSASTTAVPAFFRQWSTEGIAADATVLVAPFFRDGAGADPMVWAAFAGDAVRMPEAYAYVPGDGGTASYGPPGTQLSDIMEAIQDQGVVIVARGEARDQVARDLQAKRITDVIVGPMAHADAMAAFFTDLFGRRPEQADGVSIWRAVDSAGVVPAP